MNKSCEEGNIPLYGDDREASVKSRICSDVDIPSIHRTPDEIVNDDFHPDQNRLGITMTTLSIFAIFMSLFFIHIGLSLHQYQIMRLPIGEYVLLSICTFVFGLFSGLLAKKEWARKVVLMCLCFLKIYPLNWLVGNFLVGKLKNKRFS